MKQTNVNVKEIILAVVILSISLIMKTFTHNVSAIKENNSIQSFGQLYFSNQTAHCESEDDMILSYRITKLSSKSIIMKEIALPDKIKRSNTLLFLFSNSFLN